MASPLANGDGSALLKQQANLAEGEIVFGRRGSDWRVRQVRENAFRHIQFAETRSPAPAAGEKLFRARSLNRQSQPKLTNGPNVYVLPYGDDGTHGPLVDADLKELSLTVHKEHIHDEDDVHVGYIYTMSRGILAIVSTIPPKEHEAVIEQAVLTEVRFAGKAKDLQSGSWALVTHKG